MNPVNGLPILLKDGSTAMPAIEMPDAEDPLFVGQSQEADNGNHHTLNYSSALIHFSRQYLYGYGPQRRH